jgi:hypothetical protein
MQIEWAQAEGKNVVSKMLVRDLCKKATLLRINTLKMVTHHLVAVTLNSLGTRLGE